MKTHRYSALLLACLWVYPVSLPAQPAFQGLVFSSTKGFRHASIEDGLKLLENLAVQNNFSITATEDPAWFDPDSLARFELVVFLNTTGDVLNPDQQLAFEAFIQRGKGFVGVHAASDTEYDWPWYGQLVGRYFNGHPATQEATVEVVDHSHPATIDLPGTIDRRDEWYNFKTPFPEELQVLLTVDESTYEGGSMGEFHPVSWYREFQGGRAFYTAMGHTAATYAEPFFIQHLLGGIQWAAGQTATPLPASPTGANWKVHPNPVTDKLYLTSGPNGSLLEKVSLLAPDGRLIRSYSSIQAGQALPVADLPPGTYYLRLNEDLCCLRFLKR